MTICSKSESIADFTQALMRLEGKIDKLAESNVTRREPGHFVTISPIPDMDLGMKSPMDTGQPHAYSQFHGSSTRIQALNDVLSRTVVFPQAALELGLPESHSTAPQNMILWPCLSTELDHSSLNYPVVQETQRTRMSRSTEPPQCIVALPQDHWVEYLSVAQIRLLSRFYFDNFNPMYMILDETQYFSSHLPEGLKSDLKGGIETCLVLLVFALGSVVAFEKGLHEWQPQSIDPLGNDTGVGFFNHALNAFQESERVDWTSVQCLLLMRCVSALPCRPG